MGTPGVSVLQQLTCAIGSPAKGLLWLLGVIFLKLRRQLPVGAGAGGTFGHGKAGTPLAEDVGRRIWGDLGAHGNLEE